MKKINLTFWNIWSSYAIYYFGKVNLSIVIPALLATHENLTLYNVGLVSSGFFFAYAIGQFLHGQISERYNPFVYIALGLIGSSIMNVILGFSAGFFIILLVGEILDGMFQSMGWSSCVRANALMQNPKDRERSSVILGTSYQVGNSVAWLVSAFAVGAWGWQAGFWVASFFLFFRGITLLLTKPKAEIQPKQDIGLQVRRTFSFPIVMSGMALCLLNMVRYGVIVWIPLYLFTSRNLVVEEMGKVGLNVFLIPIMGVVGTLVYYRIKVVKDVLTIFFLLGLGLSFAIFPFTTGIMATIVLLIGSFFLYGPHVFLVTTFPTRFVEKKIVAASTGFIDGMGYIGTVLIGIIIPFLVTSTQGGWKNVFIFWTILSFSVAVFVAAVYFKLNFRFSNKFKLIIEKFFSVIGAKKTRVYAYVVGDIVHIGHLNHLRRAKKQGDYLIVGVLTDEATMEKKPKPIIPFEERLETISALKYVDKVVPQETYSPLENVKIFKPDVLMESSDHLEQPANEFIKSYGGRVVLSPYYNLQSSTKIKDKIYSLWEGNNC